MVGNLSPAVVHSSRLQPSSSTPSPNRSSQLMAAISWPNLEQLQFHEPTILMNVESTLGRRLALSALRCKDPSMPVFSILAETSHLIVRPVIAPFHPNTIRLPIAANATIRPTNSQSTRKQAHSITRRGPLVSMTAILPPSATCLSL